MDSAILLKNYRFEYIPAVIGALVEYDGVIGEIMNGLQEMQGGMYGRVTVINPKTGGVMGQPCISQLIPVAKSDSEQPEGIVLRHSIIVADKEATATKADLALMESKLDVLTEELRQLRHKMGQSN